MAATDQHETLGIYLSIPFCRHKCSFCNFASGVYAAQRLHPYLDRLIAEMDQARAWAERLNARLPQRVDSVYLGGGTPSLLDAAQVRRLFAGLRRRFEVDPAAEITVEAAPGQLAPATLEALLEAGVNRLSFGVQSFIDAEAAAVGRLHTASLCHAELDRVAAAGIPHLALDLIAGLPGQTEASWLHSLDQAISSPVDHISVYLLEVDEDSRLGREALAGGRRYGAGALPPDDAVADWYIAGSERLEAAGVAQYEISNYARRSNVTRSIASRSRGPHIEKKSATASQSCHNRRYWERAPYLGFGLDAHSMLPAAQEQEAVRWANADGLSEYLSGLTVLGQAPCWSRTVDRIDVQGALEETLFLGLRLVEGVSLNLLRRQFGALDLAPALAGLSAAAEAGLLTQVDDHLQLTARGRLASNEVFSRILVDSAA